MNFCKNRDEYISLYIDELLDDKTRIEFLKHIEECSECDIELKEASYIVQLCREEQDMILPEGFSSSLHRRLVEVSAKESKSKLGFFVYNKKLIASLSTAAVLVISLIAYNLFPQMGSKHETASIADRNAQVVASSKTDSFGTESKNNIVAESATDSTLTDGSAASAQEKNITVKEDVQLTAKFSGVVPEAGGNINNETDLFIMKLEEQADPNNQQYFLNFVELNLKVSPSGIEILDLRKFMNEIGAIEQKPVTIRSVEENSVIDYYLPLKLYSSLNEQATKHNLELRTKTDIITSDISNIFKDLNTQISEIDIKIEEALKKGEDTASLESEKTGVAEEIKKIIAQREMITVRIFLTEK